MTKATSFINDLIESENEILFDKISSDLYDKGYSINPFAMPISLTNQLFEHMNSLDSVEFSPAKIGRSQDLMQNEFIRRDEIKWINGESEAGTLWLDWCRQLKVFLNRRLILGLFSFESHFAKYGIGDFYKKHLDAFKGESNRILSVVLYLNPNWNPENGGELVLYEDNSDKVGIKVLPTFGTLVLFLSEDFPHEVLPAKSERNSIAGWFRLNSSTIDKVDPPL
jgi:SM-20-related protein